MSIELKHLILHSLRLNGEGQLSIQARQNEVAKSSYAIDLVDGLHLSYNTKAKSFGFFAQENDSNFKGNLQALINDELSFIPFTQDIGQQLVTEISKYDFIEEGVFLVAQYEHVASDYLLVMLLENKTSPAVDDSLEITASHYLETSSIQLAARIDLTDMQRNSESMRYVSYVKGRAGRKIADFFVDFLGCDDGLDVKQQNTVLLQAVDDYCKVAELDQEEKQQYKDDVKKYCEQQLKDGEEIQVAELASVMPEPADQEVDFYQFAAENYPIEEQFPADRSILKKISKCFGQGKGVSVSFERKLLGERVFYDQKTDTLTIVGIPPNLKEQLKN